MSGKELGISHSETADQNDARGPTDQDGVSRVPSCHFFFARICTRRPPAKHTQRPASAVALRSQRICAYEFLTQSFAGLLLVVV